jgi:LysM repeat protein
MSHPIFVNNLTHPIEQPARVGYCDSFLCKLRGLMFRSRLSPDEGLLLVEKKDSRLDTSIHMLFVPFDLAVIWINSDMQVVDKVTAKSWHLPISQKQTPVTHSKYTPTAGRIIKSVTRSNSGMRKFFFTISILFVLIAPLQPVEAQSGEGPVYIVQPGDSLSSIASRFSVTITELMAANNISDPNQLAAGQQLVIPGLGRRDRHPWHRVHQLWRFVSQSDAPHTSL